MERHRDSLGFLGGIEAALMLLWISKVKVTGSHPDVFLFRINSLDGLTGPFLGILYWVLALEVRVLSASW